MWYALHIEMFTILPIVGPIVQPVIYCALMNKYLDHCDLYLIIMKVKVSRGLLENKRKERSTELDSSSESFNLDIILSELVYSETTIKSP